MKKKILAVILTIAMAVSVPVTAFATDDTINSDGNSVGTEVTSEEVTTEDVEAAVESDNELSESSEATEAVADDSEDITVNPGASTETKTKESKAEPKKNSARSVDASVWESEDFTYGSYEKLLYGCDYTRQITISGVAITGFSEKGEAKLAQNKDLVIPAADNEGTAIVGVAERAFYNKGLTSVKFPTGMMVEYDDTITNRVTKRGNFVIGENAFANNNLTEVNLPEGVIACLSSAFNNNKITTVKLPRTIWWLETMSFANNRITTVNFPVTCDFQLEMHGMVFAKNFIKSVRLPDFTEVVNKDTFTWNTGKEPIADDVAARFKTYTVDGQTYDAGVVYMYADNAELEIKDRIHHTGKDTASQHSDVQKLVINDGSEETQNPDMPWNIDDFIVEGTVVKGLSESGIAKRATNKNLVIPDINKDGQYITEIAAAEPSKNGLFGSETEGFDTVELPNELQKIGNFAFQNCGISEVTFPAQLKEIGISAFSMNDLTSIIMPDTVTALGGGAFSTNPKLERISISKGLTEIPAGAFGCSDNKNWMENLKEVEIPEGITSIGNNAFAGNNFSEIVIPGSVKSIGSFAFSTKEYLTEECTLKLNKGLETIGADAFRNKSISEVDLPATVTKINKNSFRKQYSGSAQALVTKIYVSSKAQYEDTKNFPASDYHKIYLTDTSVWTAEDFIYEEQGFALYPADEYSSVKNFNVWVVKGLSESGENKLATNKELVIPAKDPDGRKVQGIADNAFKKKGITSLTLPEGVKTAYDKNTWQTVQDAPAERGDFFIGSSAFLGNSITTLNLPDGVIYVGGSAFQGNAITAVKLPESVMYICNGAFAKNNITSLKFAEKTDFKLNIDEQAFAINKIVSVQLPSNTEKVAKWAFLQNTGVEPVTTGNAAEKKGGIVYMYMTESGGALIENTENNKSNVQKLVIGNIPEEESPWNVNDFTYNEDGTVITGLSDKGKAKITKNAALILPAEGPTGEAIKALGDGSNMQGIFVYSDGGKNYSPSGVIMPSTIEKIGKWTFAINASLNYENEMTGIVLPDGLKEIGQTAFQNAKLISVSIPDSVTVMGSGAFTGCSDLTSIKLSKNVADIPASAFNAGASTEMKLQTVEIPEGVKTIGSMAFSGAHIENLILPDTLTAIGDKAFMNHQLTELELPSGVKTIGKSAFSITQEGLKNSISSLTLNDGLESIGQEAFIGNSIKSAELPSTVVLSNKNKAADCIFGKKNTPASPIVILTTSNKTQVEEGNTEFANSYSHKVVYDKLVGTGWTEGDFTYDESTGTITGWSDSGAEKRKSLKTLVLPDKTPDGKDIVAIGDNAFKIPDDEVVVTKFGIESPNGMTSVVLPENLEKIGDKAFAQNALTEVDFEGLTYIGESAFYGNQLTKAELPDTVTELGSGAFANNNITELKLSAGVTKIPQGAFSMNIRLEKVTIPDTVTEIGETAFAGARLTSLTIPKSVTKIGKKAFHLHHLTELTIPGNVKEIGESAFEGTYKATTLKRLTIEGGVESIGKYAFKEALLETVHFPDSIKTVGENPFLNNKGKDGSHVVEVTTENPEHMNFKDDTYVIKYVGTYDIKDYEDKVKLSYETTEYTGKAKKPKVTIKGLEEGKDYTVKYKDNVKAGTATVVITGMGSYTGTITKAFTITPKESVPEKPSQGDSGNDQQKPGDPADNGGNAQQNTNGQQNNNGQQNGSVQQQEVNDSAATGDNSQIMLLLILMILSGSAMVGVSVYKRRGSER